MDVQKMHPSQQRSLPDLRGVLWLQAQIGQHQPRYDLEEGRILVLLEVHAQKLVERFLLQGVQKRKDHSGGDNAIEEPVTEARQIEETIERWG